MVAPAPAVAVAVAVFVLKGESSVLLGRRLSEIGRDTFALPGGRLEFELRGLREREVKEETGMDIERIEVLQVINFVEPTGPSPPTSSRSWSGRPRRPEPGAHQPRAPQVRRLGLVPLAHRPPRPLFGPLDAVLGAGLDPFGPPPLPPPPSNAD
ncbi:unnamed protein product [Spirodela intermedia]|uniref:Nudix hydrolase domain-containing protein n=1 Tax=Spirodela intermedia TaxID=51605 RepID=A0A7I8ITN5_SPIIN|nr:unnamed protein product [Spirodela intermedia]CAA6661235.1 unnamed protein product [Spirodela intermedia]